MGSEKNWGVILKNHKKTKMKKLRAEIAEDVKRETEKIQNFYDTMIITETPEYTKNKVMIPYCNGNIVNFQVHLDRGTTTPEERYDLVVKIIAIQTFMLELIDFPETDEFGMNQTAECYDKNKGKIKEGDSVQIEGNKISQVYKKDGNLYFNIGGHEVRVAAYFQDDLEIMNGTNKTAENNDDMFEA